MTTSMDGIEELPANEENQVSFTKLLSSLKKKMHLKLVD